VVYCSLAAEGGQWELWIADAMSGGTKRFIGYGLFPEWSPTSDMIVYQRARDRGSRWFSIWTLTLIGGEPRFPTEVASAASEAMILPTWNADGTHIAFCSTTLSVNDDRLTGGSKSLRASDGQAPPANSARSRDAAAVESSVPVDVWVMQADGRGKVCLTDGYSRNYGPVFSVDGRVYFTSDRGGSENVWSVFPGGSPEAMPAGDSPHETRLQPVKAGDSGSGVRSATIVKDGL
jgi:TolB protein